MSVLLTEALKWVGKLHDGPDVPRMAREVAQVFPDLSGYCAQATNSTSWCGIFQMWILSKFKIRGPHGDDGVGGFMYVDAWVKVPWGGTRVDKSQAQPGDLLCLSNPHHITKIIKILPGDRAECVGGNQHDGCTIATFSISDDRVMGIIRPPEPIAIGVNPASGTMLHPLLKKGDTGPAVSELQTMLGLALVDGDFGDDTEVAVKAVQAAHGLLVDGEAGDDTWAALASKTAKPAPVASAGLSPEAIARIIALARSSDIARYSWSGRGRAPVGYLNGMSVTFAKIYLDWKNGGSAAHVMAAANSGDAEHDALAWHDAKFRAKGLSNATAGAATLRHLFMALYELGIRESSGQYNEGVDVKAGTGRPPEEIEAGLFQQSWNSHGASAEIPKLLTAYSGNAAGFVEIFREGVASRSTTTFGSGDAAAFQNLCKAKPAFAVECAAVGLRTIRKHWGPINRGELENVTLEMAQEADALLQQVQQVVDAIVVAPIKPPLDGDVLDPIKPGDSTPPPITTAGTPLLLMLLLNLLEKRMTTPAQGGLDLGKAFTDLRAFFQDPILQKWLSGGTITLQEFLTLPRELVGMLTGHSTQPLLPAPTKTEPEPAKVEPEPVKVEPVPVVPPKATPTVSPLWANLGTAGTLLSGIAALWAGGAMPDTTALVSSAAAAALSFTGIPAPVINGALSLLKSFKITRKAA